MPNIDVHIVKERKPEIGARPVPAWVDDKDSISPCPNCVEPPDPSTVILEGKDGFKRWIHLRCFPWLENEMPREQVEEMFYWTKHHLEHGDD